MALYKKSNNKTDRTISLGRALSRSYGDSASPGDTDWCLQLSFDAVTLASGIIWSIINLRKQIFLFKLTLLMCQPLFHKVTHTILPTPSGDRRQGLPCQRPPEAQRSHGQPVPWPGFTCTPLTPRPPTKFDI